MKIRAYTDGSCSENPGPGGWGVIFNDNENCETFSGYEVDTTNNRMEMTAMIECLKIATSRNETINDIEVYSDSAYVVNAINNKWLNKWQTNGWKTSKGDDVKNKDLWEDLISLLMFSEKVGLTIKIVKIKGHAGHTFNELVDKLATDATQMAKAKLSTM